VYRVYDRNIIRISAIDKYLRKLDLNDDQIQRLTDPDALRDYRKTVEDAEAARKRAPSTTKQSLLRLSLHIRRPKLQSESGAHMCNTVPLVLSKSFLQVSAATRRLIAMIHWVEVSKRA
jgi:hypothetical protein